MLCGGLPRNSSLLEKQELHKSQSPRSSDSMSSLGRLILTRRGKESQTKQSTHVGKRYVCNKGKMEGDEGVCLEERVAAVVTSQRVVAT